jgi:hypothetical protein
MDIQHLEQLDKFKLLNQEISYVNQDTFKFMFLLEKFVKQLPQDQEFFADLNGLEEL